VECLDKKETLNKYYDIGCSEVFTYQELMQEYARQLGLRRFFIHIRLMALAHISGYWKPVPYQRECGLLAY